MTVPYSRKKNWKGSCVFICPYLPARRGELRHLDGTDAERPDVDLRAKGQEGGQDVRTRTG